MMWAKTSIERFRPMFELYIISTIVIKKKVYN